MSGRVSARVLAIYANRNRACRMASPSGAPDVVRTAHQRANKRQERRAACVHIVVVKHKHHLFTEIAGSSPNFSTAFCKRGIRDDLYTV